jgi:hypothetical protein
LESDSAPSYRIVLLETALRWRPVPMEAMAEQLDQVVRLARRSNVDLQVVSFDIEQVAYVQHPFMVFDFAGEIQPEGLVETTTQDLKVKDANSLGSLRHYFDQLSSSALGKADSLALVRSVAASYRDRA